MATHLVFLYFSYVLVKTLMDKEPTVKRRKNGTYKCLRSHLEGLIQCGKAQKAAGGDNRRAAGGCWWFQTAAAWAYRQSTRLMLGLEVPESIARELKRASSLRRRV